MSFYRRWGRWFIDFALLSGRWYFDFGFTIGRSSDADIALLAKGDEYAADDPYVHFQDERAHLGHIISPVGAQSGSLIDELRDTGMTWEEFRKKYDIPVGNPPRSDEGS